VAFAPFDKPEIAVAVVVEHGGGGGAVAAPIAGRILRNYFDLQKPPAPRQKTEDAPQDESQAETPVKKLESQAQQGADE